MPTVHVQILNGGAFSGKHFLGRGGCHPAASHCGPAGQTSRSQLASDLGNLVSDLIPKYTRQSLTVLHSGCGPLGLLILAVAKAYGVRKIVMFDIEQSRIDFALKYGAHAGFVPPRREESKQPLEFAQEYTKSIIAELGIEHGFDVAVEASGAEVCAQMAICSLKNGGTCKLSASAPDLIAANEINRHTGRSREASYFRSIIPTHGQGAQHQG